LGDCRRDSVRRSQSALVADNWIMRTLTLRFVLAAALCAGACEIASADSSIRVTVNDAAITTYDISQRLRLMQVGHEKGGEKDAINALIDEALEVAEAKAHGIIVPDSQVNSAYANIASNMKTSVANLDKMLGSAGIIPETLKRRIKAQIAWSQVVQSRARYQIAVKSSDIEAALLAQKPDKLVNKEYILQSIIFVVPKGSSNAYAEQRRREAQTFRLRYAGCDKAYEQAKALRDVTVRSAGRFTSDQLNNPSNRDVTSTPAGKATPPQSIAGGIQMIGICSVRDLKGDSAPRAEIENKLFVEKGKDLGVDYLKELRKRAIIKYR